MQIDLILGKPGSRLRVDEIPQDGKSSKPANEERGTWEHGESNENLPHENPSNPASSTIPSDTVGDGGIGMASNAVVSYPSYPSYPSASFALRVPEVHAVGYATTNAVGWRQELQPAEQAQMITSIASSLRLVRPDIEENQATEIATTFENSVYSKAQSKEDYIVQCRTKLLLIREARKRQLAEQEMRTRNNQRGY